jgi:hypothetical protein
MEKVTNKDIANFLDKQVSTVNSWASRNPKLLELVKLGAFCKKNNITINDIKTCIKMKELAKGGDEST